MLEDDNRVRLFSVSGIKGQREAEQRATAALLSVLTMVRPYSQAMLTPLGASRAERARVEAWSEPVYDIAEGETVRPDGVVTVTSGRQSFRALVEVKIGGTKLGLDQITKYQRLCREQGFDALITVSGEVAPFDGAHPTAGTAALAQGKTALHHWSWTRVLAYAVKECVHHGVDDAEQEWVLSEFIRYLEHPNSGVPASNDMGEHWTSVRDATRDGLLSKIDAGVADVCQRWDQLMHGTALRLSAELGRDVREVVPRAHRRDPAVRLRQAVSELCDDGVLRGLLRVPDAISDVSVKIDLRAGRVVNSVECDAPTDKGARGRVSWLVRQLRHAEGCVSVEAFARNGKTPTVVPLAALREDPTAALRANGTPPARFRVSQRSEMGQGRRTVRKLGFADSVTNAVDTFYSDVVQHMRKAVVPAPPMAEPIDGGDRVEVAPDAERADGAEASATLIVNNC